MFHVYGFDGLKPVSEFGLKDFWLAVRQDFCSTVRLLAFSSFSLLAQIYVSKVSPECVKIPIKKNIENPLSVRIYFINLPTMRIVF